MPWHDAEDGQGRHQLAGPADPDEDEGGLERCFVFLDAEEACQTAKE